MVKIRLRRIGAKKRPFYRVVVSKSSSGRNGAFVETLGTYDPTAEPSLININEDRALYWLLSGAQPTETTAYILKTAGVLPKFLEQRPQAAKGFKFLDRAIAIQPSSATPAAPAKGKAKEEVEAPAAAPEATEPTPAPVAEAAPVEPEAEAAVEATPES